MTNAERKKIAERRKLRREAKHIAEKEAAFQQQRLEEDARAWRRHQNSPKEATLADHLEGYMTRIAASLPQFQPTTLANGRRGLRCVLQVQDGPVAIGTARWPDEVKAPGSGEVAAFPSGVIEQTAYLAAVHNAIIKLEEERRPQIGSGDRYEWRIAEERPQTASERNVGGPSKPYAEEFPDIHADVFARPKTTRERH